MTRSLYTPASPVLSPERLRALAQELLDMTTADTMGIRIDHQASGVARVGQGRVRLTMSGDTLDISIFTQFGQRIPMSLSINQIDRASLQQAVRYLDRVASQQLGDPVQTAMPIPPRTYLPNTSWQAPTVAAFSEGRHTVVPGLVTPLLDAKLRAAAFIGVTVRSRAIADKQGMLVAGEETDSEVVATGWTQDGKGSGWAGQATRNWSEMNVPAVAQEAVRLTKLAENPVALEPGRRVAILDRPAVAQLVQAMGGAFSARLILSGRGPMYDRVAHRPKLGDRVIDPRVTLSTDPNDKEGGYLPFNGAGYPLIPMAFVENGVFTRMAFDTMFAAEQGVTPANDPPDSLRMSGGTTSVEEMIANCKEGIYVNRFAQLMGVDGDSGTVVGVTNGGCYLVKNGKITKAVKHFRFVESPWFIFNRIEAIGPTQRTAFGYAPWAGSWPIAPTIVPPVMVRDFNFAGMADAV